MKPLTILLCLVCIAGTAAAQQAAVKSFPEKETASIFSLPRFHAQVTGTNSTSAKNTVFEVKINNPEGKLIQVSIEGDDLAPLEYDYSRAKTYEKNFNFCNVDDGLYRVRITCGKERLIKKIRIKTYTDIRRTTSIE